MGIRIGLDNARLLKVVAICLAAAVTVLGLNIVQPAAQAAESPFLDTSFAQGGKYVKDSGLAAGSGFSLVDVDSAGRILAVYRGPTESQLQVIRLLPSGIPDLSFGIDGRVTFEPDRGVNDLRVAEDDKVLLVGWTERDGWYGVPAITRLDVDGRLDTAFGTLGVATLPSSAEVQPNDARFGTLELDPDGSLVVAGEVSPPGSGGLQNVWRFSADGTLVTDFHQIGDVPRPTDAVSSSTGDLAIDGDGRILLAGGGGRIVPGKRDSQGYGSVLRFLPGGQLDTTFGDQGTLYQFDSGIYGVDAWSLSDIVAFADGSFIAPNYNKLSHYSSSGAILRNLTTPQNFSWADFEVDAVGRLVVGGSLYPGVSQFVVLRFKPDGSPDGSFGRNGVVYTSFQQGESYLTDAALAPDGGIVAGGFANTFGTSENPDDSGFLAMARYVPSTGSSVKQNNDYNGDNLADVIARDATGALWLYPGNGRGGWQPRVRVGSGWNVMNYVLAPGDFSGDGKADVLARDKGGLLWLYPGDGRSGWQPRLRVGSGWNVMNYLLSPGDFNGDAKADVLARDATGVLWLYPGNGHGGWSPRVRVGSGWNIMSALVAPGDFDGDGKTDVLAKDGSGVLWLYPGDAHGGWLPRTRIGTGWNVMNQLAGPGDLNGDGKVDVLARESSGLLWLYPSNGSGGWLPRLRVGAGWNIMASVV